MHQCTIHYIFHFFNLQFFPYLEIYSSSLISKSKGQCVRHALFAPQGTNIVHTQGGEGLDISHKGGKHFTLEMVMAKLTVRGRGIPRKQSDEWSKRASAGA